MDIDTNGAKMLRLLCKIVQNIPKWCKNKDILQKVFTKFANIKKSKQIFVVSSARPYK